MKDRNFCCDVYELYDNFHSSLAERVDDRTVVPKLAVSLFQSMNRANNKNWDWQNLYDDVDRKRKNLSFYIKDYLRADYTILII